MFTFIKTTLLISILTILIFLGIKSISKNREIIKYSKEISKLSDTDHKIGIKLDKILENITAGIYNKYTKKKTKIEELEYKIKQLRKSVNLYLYYFFGVFILFSIIFFYIDYKFLIIYIGTSSLISLFLALKAPLIMIGVYKSLPIIGVVTLSFETKSIIGTIEKLFIQHNYLIALLILAFSIVIPLIKSLTVLMYGFLKKNGFGKNIIYLIDKLGKWSMSDVFIVALMVVFFSTKQDIHSVIKIESGLYFFIGYVLISMIGSSLLNKKEN